MSNIDFKHLIENLLTEGSATGKTVKDILIQAGTKLGIENSDINTLKSAGALAINLKRGGSARLVNAEIFAKHALWPLADIIFFLLERGVFKSVRGSFTDNDFNVAIDATTDPDIEKELSQFLDNPDSYNVQHNPVLRKLSGTSGGKPDLREIKAEKYINLSPLNALLTFAKDAKGYDLNLIKNVLSFPEQYKTISTTKPEYEEFEEISLSLKMFYVEYITNPKFLTKLIKFTQTSYVNTEYVLPNNIQEVFENIKKDAGNQSGKSIFSKDYINFINGTSKFIINVPENLTTTTPGNTDNKYAPQSDKQYGDFLSKLNRGNVTGESINFKTKDGILLFEAVNVPSLIQKVSDFKTIQGAKYSLAIYDMYLDIIKNFRKGSIPSGWKVAGNLASSLLKGAGSFGSSMKPFTTN
jgi:hypothetical protein